MDLKTSFEPFVRIADISEEKEEELEEDNWEEEEEEESKYKSKSIG